MYKAASGSLKGQAVGPGGPDGSGARELGQGSRGEGVERRRNARCQPVGEQLVTIQLGENNPCVVVDLSVGGAAVIATEPLEHRSRKSFAMQFGDPVSEIKGTGVLVWVDSTGLNGGLCFDRLAPEAQSRLEHWLSDQEDAQQALFTSAAKAQQEAVFSELDIEQELANSAVEAEPELAPSQLEIEQELANSAKEAEPEFAFSEYDIEQELANIAAEAEPEFAASELVNQQELATSALENEPEPAISAKPVGEPAENGALKAVTPEANQSESKDDSAAGKLYRLAERARRVALAQGACIALKRDVGFLCEASVGAAPIIGVTVNEERGLAAECIAGRHLVVCNDAARDPRVSLDSGRHLSLGSAIFLPLCRGNELAGVLGVFSERCDAFGAQTIARLQDTARLVEVSLYGRTSESSRDNRVAERVAEEYRAASANSGGGLAASTARILTLSLIATMVLLGVLYLYQLRVSSPPVQPPRAPVSSRNFGPKEPVQPVPAAIVPAPAAEKHEAVVPREQPLPPLQDEVVIKSWKPVETTSVPHTNVPNKEVAAAKKSAVPAPPNVAVQPPPVSRPQESATPPRATPAVTAPVPPMAKPTPPQSSGHVQVLTELLRPKPDANGPETVPELNSKVEIGYPPAALAVQRQGSVILKVTVDEAGNVNNILVLDGDDTLAAEAVRVVRQWRYKPYAIAGRQVGMELLLTVNFVLSR